MTQTTLDLINYYANLLIRQYLGSPRAYATIQSTVTPIIMPQTSMQVISFSPVPTSGTFVLIYEGGMTTPLSWNASAAEIQAALEGLSPMDIYGGDSSTVLFDSAYFGGTSATTDFVEDIYGGDAAGFGFTGITVTGSIASGSVTVTFDGVTPPAAILGFASNTLMDGSVPVVITITETDLTLPLAVQAGFNLLGTSPAIGNQLDTLGKYAGVTRTGAGFTAQITLDDADFLTLIQMAIIKNNAGSSLSTIVGLLFQFFGNEISVTDYQDMFMSLAISSSVGSDDLLQLFIGEGLLPVPMAVGYDIVIFDATDPFVFETNPVGAGFSDTANPTEGGELSYVFL